MVELPAITSNYSIGFETRKDIIEHETLPAPLSWLLISFMTCKALVQPSAGMAVVAAARDKGTRHRRHAHGPEQALILSQVA